MRTTASNPERNSGSPTGFPGKSQEQPALQSVGRTGVPARALRLLLVAYIVLIAFPVRYYPLKTGQDPSWAFAMNYAHTKGLIFGRDVAFTYGPIAWVALPMDVGRNLWQGIAVQIVFWFVFAAVAAWFVLVRKAGLLRSLAFALCLLGGLRSFEYFDYSGPEIFVAFVGLMLLGGVVSERRWYFFQGASCALGAALLLVKFSAGLLVLGALVLLPAGLWALDRRKAVKSAAALLFAPAAFATGYLLYYPSLPALGRYLRASFEVASGYSTAMSAPSLWPVMGRALIVLLSWLMLTAVLYRKRDRAFPLALAFLAPLFLIFKHSFVCEPGHVVLFFAFAPLLWGIVLMFTQITRRNILDLAPPLFLCVAVWCVTIAPAVVQNRFGLARIHSISNLFTPSDLRAHLNADSQKALAADRLPAGLLARLSSEPVAIFPYECAYAAANPLNFRPFPLLQLYSAYTPHLDAWDADFLEDDRTAPRFVLFDWQSIYGRHPLLDVPATALALYRRYDFDSAASGHILLRRRSGPRFGALRSIGTRELRLGRPFPIPASRHPLIGRIDLRLSAAGTLRKLFFRIPAVTMMNARVPPEVAVDGVPLNFLPWNLEEARILFSGGTLPSRARSLTVDGPGACFFRDPVKVEILEIPDVNFSDSASEFPSP
jgi:hypothetical protein